MTGLFRKISELWRPSPRTPEELAARLEAERLKQQIRVARIGDRQGGRLTHGGKDERVG